MKNKTTKFQLISFKVTKRERKSPSKWLWLVTALCLCALHYNTPPVGTINIVGSISHSASTQDISCAPLVDSETFVFCTRYSDGIISYSFNDIATIFYYNKPNPSWNSG